MTHRLFSGADESTSAEARLRAYLDALDKPVTSLGEAVREDWRSEAEQHLRSLITAHEELGSTHAEAVSAALKQFGRTPERIGGQVFLETMRTAQDANLMQASARAVCDFIVVSSVAVAALGGVAGYYAVGGGGLTLLLLRIAAGVGFVAVPAVGGWRVGTQLSAWLRSGGARTRTAWRRPSIDRVALPFRLHERVPDGDLLPAIVIATAFTTIPTGAMFALLSTNFAGPNGANPRFLLAGLLWFPIAAAFGALAWKARSRRPAALVR